jgi:hypothetical protein
MDAATLRSTPNRPAVQGAATLAPAVLSQPVSHACAYGAARITVVTFFDLRIAWAVTGSPAPSARKAAALLAGYRSAFMARDEKTTSRWHQGPRYR